MKKFRGLILLGLVSILTACTTPSSSAPTTGEDPTSNPTTSEPTGPSSVTDTTSDPTTAPVVPVEKYVELTVDSLGIPSETYHAGDATVSGIAFSFEQIGNYGNGIQMRDKDGKTSKLWNTTAFGSGITKIELTYASTMEVKYSNPDAVIYSFGDSADNLTYTTKLSTSEGQKSYTVTPNATTYEYLYIEHDLGYSMYWDSIKIYYYDGQGGGETPIPPTTVTDPTTSTGPVVPVEKYVELTVDSLGIPSETYHAGDATVSGIAFSFEQIGNYGNGIQMRDKDGKTSKLWNTTAFGSGITKIELTYASTMDVKYSNEDAVIYSFGNSADNLTYTTKLSTTEGQKSYTITPNSSSYTFLYIEHDLGYSMYWDSIKIYYGGSNGGTTSTTPTTNPSTPSTSQPSTTTPSTSTAVVELTVDSLGIPSQSYIAGDATVSGIKFSFEQIGNYGNGIQMRDKDGNTSKLWNTTAFGDGITKIELTYASTMEVKYSNPDAVIYSFGDSPSNLTYTTKLSTTEGQKSYTITPNSSSYTFLYIEHDLGYSMYWDSIKIYYNGEPGEDVGNSSTSTPSTTVPSTSTGSNPSYEPGEDTYDGNYYNGIDNSASANTLLGELRDLIVDTHDTYTSYSDCGSGSSKLKLTDADPNKSGNIILFYSGKSVAYDSSDFNREHVWPKSTGLWETSGGGSDMHHIRPTLMNINSSRGNLEFGEANNGSEVKQDGYLGGYKSGSVFEPLDNVKGDVARIIMYMFVHYNSPSNIASNTNKSGSVPTTASSKTSGNLPITNVIDGSKAEAFELLLKWHHDDPVDAREVTRNNEVYKIQGNRNPFIDVPSYADIIWG